MCRLVKSDKSVIETGVCDAVSAGFPVLFMVCIREYFSDLISFSGFLLLRGEEEVGGCCFLMCLLCIPYGHVFLTCRAGESIRRFPLTFMFESVFAGQNGPPVLN